MQIPDELLPVAAELERTWGVLNPRIQLGFDMGVSLGYPQTVLAMTHIYVITQAIQDWLRDGNVEVHRELAGERKKT